MRLWYARRGISWVPLLACLCPALVVVPIGDRWPGSLAVLLPGALALCAASCGFVFDERATAVVSVTPRGAGWRRTTRCVVAVLPALVWVALVTGLDGREPRIEWTGWVVAGLGAQLVALGLAAVASRREVSAPGSSIASLLVILVLMPLVVGPLAGWEPVLPVGPFQDWVIRFWVAAALVGAALVARAVRPGLR
jgi:hypothetical protein